MDEGESTMRKKIVRGRNFFKDAEEKANDKPHCGRPSRLTGKNMIEVIKIMLGIVESPLEKLRVVSGVSETSALKQLNSD